MPDGSTQNPFTNDAQLTLQDVFELIAADTGLPVQRRRNLQSALRAVGKLMKRDLALLPAHPRFYRDLFKDLHPEHCGLSRSRIRNIKSDLRAALRHTGCIEQGRTYLARLSSDWQALRDDAEAAGVRARYLSRFMRFCSANGISPSEVDDAVSEQFRQALIEESFIKDPAKTHQNICRLWNQAAQTVPGWPEFRLTVPLTKTVYTFPLSAFPQSLQDEVAALFDHWAGKDLLDDSSPVKPLSPRTLQDHDYKLRQILSALVHQGRDMDELTRLIQIVEVEAAKTALRFHIDRNDGKTSSQIHGLAILLKTIGKNWIKVDEDHLEELKALCNRVDPKQKGLTDKNRERLRQFDDPSNVDLMLNFPGRLVEAALKNDNGRRRGAIDVQIALAVELLLMAPIRAANLVNIEIDRHIVRTRNGRKGKTHLVIPGEEVKNGEPLEFELPEETVDLLDLYLREFHPRLTDLPAPWLFPGGQGGPKTREFLGDQVSKRVFKETGLHVNLHLFRHIAAKLYLDQEPGGYEVVRRLLGHRSMDTTLSFYAGQETAAATRHYDDTVLKLRRNGKDKDR